MKNVEQTTKKWKFLLLIGRPCVFIGLLLIIFSFSEGVKGYQQMGGLGFLLLMFGFIAAWTGKIGAYWFHD